MNLEQLTTLAPAQLKAMLPGWLCGYVQAEDGLLESICDAVQQIITEMPESMLVEGLAAYAGLGEGYIVHRAHPMTRAISRSFMKPILQGSTVEGLEHLAAIAGQPQVWMSNHLSYIDTQATDALLSDRGLTGVVDALLTVAGPKVYSDPFRRFAALGVNTLKTPQSSTLDTNDGGLSPREVARLAIDCVTLTERWRVESGPVLLYPEGTRSRTGSVGPFLRAVARYARAPRDGTLWIVPMGISGTEKLFPRDERMYPQPVRLSIGEPFDAAEAGRGKTAVLDAARTRLAALLPPDYRPDSD